MDYSVSNFVLLILIGIMVFAVIYFIAHYLIDKVNEKKQLQRRIESLAEQQVATDEEIDLFSEKIDVGIIEKRIRDLLAPVDQSTRIKLWYNQSGIEVPMLNIIINVFSFSTVGIAIIYLLFDGSLFKTIWTVYGSGAFLTYMIIKRIRQKRQRVIVEALPDSLIMIVQFLKAGFNLDGALDVCAKETGGVLGAEIKKALLRINSGVIYEEALKESARRVGITAYSIFMGGLVIQRRLGASATLVIDNVINILQKRKELEAKIKTMSAEATATYAILIMSQVLLAAALWYNSPPQIMYFFTDADGQDMGLVILFMLVAQYLSFKALTKVRME